MFFVYILGLYCPFGCKCRSFWIFVSILACHNLQTVDVIISLLKIESKTTKLTLSIWPNSSIETDEFLKRLNSSENFVKGVSLDKDIDGSPYGKWNLKEKNRFLFFTLFYTKNKVQVALVFCGRYVLSIYRIIIYPNWKIQSKLINQLKQN